MAAINIGCGGPSDKDANLIPGALDKGKTAYKVPDKTASENELDNKSEGAPHIKELGPKEQEILQNSFRFEGWEDDVRSAAVIDAALIKHIVWLNKTMGLDPNYLMQVYYGELIIPEDNPKYSGSATKPGQIKVSPPTDSKIPDIQKRLELRLVTDHEASHEVLRISGTNSRVVEGLVHYLAHQSAQISFIQRGSSPKKIDFCFNPREKTLSGQCYEEVADAVRRVEAKFPGTIRSLLKGVQDIRTNDNDYSSPISLASLELERVKNDSNGPSYLDRFNTEELLQDSPLATR